VSGCGPIGAVVGVGALLLAVGLLVVGQGVVNAQAQRGAMECLWPHYPCPLNHAYAHSTPSERFAPGDKSCNDEIIPQISGYCLCDGNVTAARCARSGGRGWLRYRGRSSWVQRSS